MGLTNLAVRRPVATLMSALAVLLLGLISLQKLSIDLMPDMSYPTLSVITLYPGAGPAEVETLVTRPMEQALSSVGQVERLSSSSSEGSSTIRVRLQWGTDIDAAIADMRQALQRMQQSQPLPEDVEEPYIRQYDVADFPIIYLGLGSDLDPIPLTRLAELQVIPQLERLPGVARVRLRGEAHREIQVELDRGKLESLQMGVNEVVDALQRENVNRPAGDLDQGAFNVLIRSRGEFESLEEIANTVVRSTSRATVRLRDVARVVDGEQERTEVSRINGKPGLLLYIYKQSGANTTAVSDEVHAAISRINEGLEDAELQVRVDKANFIRNAIQNVRMAAVYGMGLAFLVLIVFLRSLRSTLIIGASMPLSVLATFVLIYFRGYTLNMVSFGGLALGIGLLVDNSIVVLESIFRKLDAGLEPRRAAVEGTGEVAAAIVASTLTTLIVFLPLMFIDGVTGIMLHQLAAVVAFSLMCSLVVSLTLTPMLAAVWLRSSATKVAADGARRPAGDDESAAGGILERAYGRLLRGSLRSAWFAAPVLLACFAGSVGMLPLVRTEFMPPADEGELSVDGRMAAGIQLEALDRQATLLEGRILDAVPEAVATAAFIGDGADDSEDWNRAMFRLQLVPRTQRERGLEEVRQHLEDRVGTIPGMRLSVRASTSSRLFRAPGGGDGEFTVEIRGHDLEAAELLADEVLQRLSEIEGLVNVQVEREERRPELSIRIDREKAAVLGISVQDVASALETTVKGSVATVYREGGDEFKVLVRLQSGDRQGMPDLEHVGLQTPGGSIVPLKSLVRFEAGEAPVAINRLDQQRMIEVSADVEQRSLGEVVADVRRSLQRIDWPEGFAYNIGGDWEEQQKSFDALTWGFVLALVLMYMVMASQFESLIDPLTIVCTIPLGAIGVILVLALTETTLNVQSFIGVVMLSGIVVNNAIVLVDYFNQLRLAQPSADLQTLLIQAGCRRFRPIIMTTLTTVLAMVPVALAWGEGGELQAPMARVVIGGLLSSTVTTLIAIPLLLQAVHRGRRRTAGGEVTTEIARDSRVQETQPAATA